MFKVIVHGYKGKNYNKFIKTLAGSDSQEDLKVAWELAWRMKQFKKDIVLPCFDADDAEQLQNKLRKVGALVRAEG